MYRPARSQETDSERPNLRRRQWPNAKAEACRAFTLPNNVKRRSIVIVKSAHGPPMLKRSTRDL
jgi:hypothetical protein